MNKLTSILVGLLAISNIIYSFWKNPESEHLFFFEMNTWIYRLFWILLTVVIIYNLFNKKTTNK